MDYKTREYICKKINQKVKILYKDNGTFRSRKYIKCGIDCNENCKFEHCDVYKEALEYMDYNKKY